MFIISVYLDDHTVRQILDPGPDKESFSPSEEDQEKRGDGKQNPHRACFRIDQGIPKGNPSTSKEQDSSIRKLLSGEQIDIKENRTHQTGPEQYCR